MPKQMHASIAVDLSADEFEEAAEKLKLKPLWDTFLSGLTEAGVKHTAKLETIETRAKPATNGARRTRRTAAQIAADKAAHEADTAALKDHLTRGVAIDGGPLV